MSRSYLTMQKNKTDIKENYLYSFNAGILKILLMNRATHKNIIWAIADYASLGEQYAADREIILGLSEVMASLVLVASCSSHSTCTSKSLSNFWGAYHMLVDIYLTRRKCRKAVKPLIK